jgi:glyoxylase-like metal-dependent hydrolase (beta-lactamase superfamily II)
VSDSPVERACPECGAAQDAHQEVCVECGARTSTDRRRRIGRLAARPLALAVVAILVVASAAYAVTMNVRTGGDVGSKVAVAPPAPPAEPPAPEAPAADPPKPATTESKKPPAATPAPAPPTPSGGDAPTAPQPSSSGSSPSGSSNSSGGTSDRTRPARDRSRPHRNRGDRETGLGGDSPYSAAVHDPFGGGGDEHAADAPKAIDGKPGSAWTTRSHPGGLGKPGVGLVLETGGYQGYSALALLTRTPGFDVSVYSTDQSDPPAGGPDDPAWRLEGRKSGVAKRQRINLRGATSEPSYYLVWITKLPAGRSRAGLSEISLLLYPAVCPAGSRVAGSPLPRDRGLAMLYENAADGIHRVEDAYTNWYIVEDGDALTIVDAGVPTSWASLEDALSRLGRRRTDVKALVLTHAHFDHIGFAERARRELGVPVYVHENDVPLTRHPLQYSHERSRAYYFLTQVQAFPIVASLVRNRAFWPDPIAEVTRYSNGSLDVPGSPRVLFTPGHTIGHCALHFPDRDVVIAGDAFVMLDPYTAEKGPKIVARAATADSQRNLDSLDAIAETGAGTVLTGHGEAWTGGAAEGVRRARLAGTS